MAERVRAERDGDDDRRDRRVAGEVPRGRRGDAPQQARRPGAAREQRRVERGDGRRRRDDDALAERRGEVERGPGGAERDTSRAVGLDHGDVAPERQEHEQRRGRVRLRGRPRDDLRVRRVRGPPRRGDKRARVPRPRVAADAGGAQDRAAERPEPARARVRRRGGRRRETPCAARDGVGRVERQRRDPVVPPVDRQEARGLVEARRQPLDDGLRARRWTDPLPPLAARARALSSHPSGSKTLMRLALHIPRSVSRLSGRRTRSFSRKLLRSSHS